MTIRDHRGWYTVETKIHPNPESKYSAATSTAEQESAPF